MISGNSQIDLGAYEARWGALARLIDEMDKRFDKQVGQFPRQSTVIGLLRALHAFAKRQFYFFYNGFTGGIPQLLESTDYAPRCVLATTLYQIQNDLEVIVRAAEQRIMGTELERIKLADADRLAWLALQPALPLLGKGKKTTLTYFQKSSSIRVLPYAGVALIGIPYTCTLFPRDFLAIPHEIGHFVYWHRDDPQPPEIKSTSPYRKWWEEVFADVYAASTAGPIMAFDFQELSAEFSKELFTQDDHHHPSPHVRPTIYAKAIKARGAKNLSGEAADKLEARWEQLRAARDNMAVQQLSAKGQKAAKANGKDDDPLQDLSAGANLDRRKTLDHLIGEALNQLDGLPFNCDWLSGLANIPFDKIDERFADEVPNLLETVPEKDLPELNPEAEVAGRWSEWVQNQKVNLLTSPIAAGTLDDLKTKPNGTWIFVFNAQGWTTEGPQAQPPTGL